MRNQFLSLALLTLFFFGGFSAEATLLAYPFYGTTTFVFEGELGIDSYNVLKSGEKKFWIAVVNSNLVEEVFLQKGKKKNLIYEEKGLQKLTIKKGTKFNWNIKKLASSNRLLAAVGDDFNKTIFPIKNISIKVKGNIPTNPVLPCLVTLNDTYGFDVLCSLVFQPEAKGKNLKFTYKNENLDVKLTINSKREFKITFKVKDYIVPKFIPTFG